MWKMELPDFFHKQYKACPNLLMYLSCKTFHYRAFFSLGNQDQLSLSHIDCFLGVIDVEGIVQRLLAHLELDDHTV